MAGSRTQSAIDTIVSSVFRFVLFFGLATHVYDTKTHRLSPSRWAHSYSVSLHLTLVLLFVVAYQLSRTHTYPTESHFFETLYMLYLAIVSLLIFACMALQWTLRANAAAHFNIIFDIWHKDMAGLEISSEINHQTAGLFLCKALTSSLILLNGVLGTYYKLMNSFPAAQSIYMLVLCNLLTALMTLFSSGLVFSLYIFRQLNFNLRRIVQDVCDIRYTRAPGHIFRQKAVKLETELSAIQRIHVRLQRWVVRFKNLYQVEVMLYLMSFLVLQVFTLFIMCVLIYEQWVYTLRFHFIALSASFTLYALDNSLMLYIVGQLLAACNGTGEIVKDLPSRRLLHPRLERCVEMLCLQLGCEKLRLSICGLVDMDWSNIFAMTEAAILYIILLIQMDYKNL